MVRSVPKCVPSIHRRPIVTQRLHHRDTARNSREMKCGLAARVDGVEVSAGYEKCVDDRGVSGGGRRHEGRRAVDVRRVRVAEAGPREGEGECVCLRDEGVGGVGGGRGVRGVRCVWLGGRWGAGRWVEGARWGRDQRVRMCCGLRRRRVDTDTVRLRR